MYHFSVISHIGKVRSANQDNYYLSGHIRELEQSISEVAEEFDCSSKWITAVFDGMGGEHYGEIASLEAARALSDGLRQTDTASGDRLLSIVTDMNAAVVNAARGRGVTMGSTCVLAEQCEGMIRVCNVGDSRAYLFRDNMLTQLTQDHTEAAVMRCILGEEADSSFLRGENTLTQHLGVSDEDFIIEPYLSDWIRVQNSDVFLLCTDGLTHMVSNERIAEILSENGSVTEMSGRLVNAALDNGDLDNITVMAVKCI